MLKDEIREILNDLCYNTMGNPKFRIDQALSTILSKIRERVPKEYMTDGSITYYREGNTLANKEMEIYNQAHTDILKEMEG